MQEGEPTILVELELLKITQTREEVAITTALLQEAELTILLTQEDHLDQIPVFIPEAPLQEVLVL